MRGTRLGCLALFVLVFVCGVSGDEEEISVQSEEAALPAPESAPQVPDAEKQVEDAFEQAKVLIGSTKPKDRNDGIKILEELADRGVASALNELADLYYFGDHRDGKNIEKALHLFAKAAEAGSPHAQHMTGLFHTHGLHNTPKDSAKALLYQTFAAQGDSTEAQLVLAHRYNMGIGVLKGCFKSAFYYNLAADKVIESIDYEALEVLGDPLIRLNEDLDHIEKQRGEERDVVDFYHYSAENGDAQAQVRLGTLYLKGSHGLDVNPSVALTYLQRALDSGDLNACGPLGQMYMRGIGVPPNNETALEYFTKGAKKGLPASLNGLGYMHLHGLGTKKNVTAAADYFRKAADRGSTEAQYNLGLLHMHPGAGPSKLKQDYNKALRYFTAAANAGHVLATFHLAQLHLNALGTTMNCPLAVQYLKRVVLKGPWSGILSDALKKHRQGDDESALVLYLDASDQGFEVGSFNAAYLLHQTPSRPLLSFLEEDQGSHDPAVKGFKALGHNLTSQYQLARDLYHASASLGVTEAYVFLGDMKFYGLASDVDHTRAAEFYRLAVETRLHPQAMYNLGYMYQHGHGVQQDFHLAKRHYDMVGTHVQGSRAVAYAALAGLFAQWGYHLALERASKYTGSDELLLAGLVTLLILILTVLYLRLTRRNGNL